MPIRQSINIGLCLLVLVLFYVLGSFIASVLPLPISGSLYGLGLLLSLLFLNRSFAQWITEASMPLMKHMIFFFIPPVMAIHSYWDVLHQHALALFIAVFVTTLFSIAVVGIVAQKRLAKSIDEES